MTLFWIIIVPLLIVVAALTIADVFRHPYGGWAKAVWVLFIVLLPIIGSIAYWIARKPAEDELEQAYRAEAALRAEAQRLPIDRSGF